jgi:hypothetical protein
MLLIKFWRQTSQPKKVLDEITDRYRSFSTPMAIAEASLFHSVMFHQPLYEDSRSRTCILPPSSMRATYRPWVGTAQQFFPSRPFQ